MSDGIGSPTVAVPFDAVAHDYDAGFSDTKAGRWLRETVWLRLVPFVRPGMECLDLGCGTGEDALWLAGQGGRVVAADNSAVMLNIAAAKAVRHRLENQITTAAVDINALERTTPELERSFDLLLSNFGAVNCVEDLGAFARRVQRWVKPNGVVAVTGISRFCAWEFAWYLPRFNAAAVRRWGGRATASIGGRQVRIRYWTARDLCRALSPEFRAVGVYGIGVLLPPSYLFHLVDRWPKLFAALARWDRVISSVWPLSRIGDHMLVVFRRNGTAAG